MSKTEHSNSLGGITETLEALALRYPEDLVAAQQKGIARNAFHIEYVKKLVAKEDLCIADIGGGIGLFSPGCAAMGMTVTLIDDFSELVNLSELGRSSLCLHSELGVNVLTQEVTLSLALPSNHFDVVTCFDSMEHWHNSPKAAFHKVVDSLRPGGWFMISVPNCVNLRKRVTVPLGYGKWSTMAVWYEEERFRGHVREPDVDDLRYIAKDLGLKDVRVFGRNWYGAKYPLLRAFMPVLDAALRLKPSICSNIYVAGQKA